ncbi:MAG: hypothetical protein IPG74_04370 [Flavobacteriales bacterium]|nr:hypothetical protein [Flavobacteriales bacterium]MBK7554015.1 hypothetical protein [Flavobacteriales bacterium]
MEPNVFKRFLFVKDDFYDDPLKVYRAAQEATYYEPENYTGLRSTTVYHEQGVRAKLERLLGVRITRWDTDAIQENGVFYQAFAQGKKKEIPGVHADTPYDDITAVVYLTPGLPFDRGTSLWMHKRTGLSSAPTAAAARKLKMKLADLLDLFEQDSRDRSKWVEVDRAGYRPNRVVAYPSGLMHSATNHHGGSLQDVRLYQTFRIGVDWKRSKFA